MTAFEIFATIKNKTAKKYVKAFLEEDLEKRFKKALVDELQLNPPISIEFEAAEKTFAALEKTMEGLYLSENLKEDCSLVKIKISIETEVVNEQ